MQKAAPLRSTVRYIVFIALVLNWFVVAVSLLGSIGWYFEWRSNSEDALAEPERLQERLRELERIGRKYASSPNPRDREEVRARLPAALDSAREESRVRAEKYRREARSSLIGLVWCLGLVVVLGGLGIFGGRFYRRMRPSFAADERNRSIATFE